MNSLQNLIQRLSAIGQVNEEAEEKCSKCGCTPCECDEEKVDESKKVPILASIRTFVFEIEMVNLKIHF